jgi:ornithine lipid ester-linked acyl 2-hydroxylase
VTTRSERFLSSILDSNNRRVRSSSRLPANPVPTEDLSWHELLLGSYPAIRSEWDQFVSSGGRLPLIEDVVMEHQGNDGAWRAGLLVSRGKPCLPLASLFPETMGALRRIPGLRSALWSLMDSGVELPEHSGPNAGVLRYHLGVACGDASALRIGEVEIAHRDRFGILFDDTVPHAAWNRGAGPRVTLFCEVYRPLPAPQSWVNRAVQALLGLDPRYRRAPRRAAEWHHALNG